MTVWSVDKNAEAKTMVITAEFTASIANVWRLWADPRLLERWWGPPGFPATFEQHDLRPGGTITYFMSGPDGGDRFDSTWNVVEVWSSCVRCGSRGPLVSHQVPLSCGS